MGDPEQIERDIREYLEKEPNLRREDRIKYLKALFNKHLEIDKLEHVINYGDLFEIISHAKNVQTNARLPMKITRKPIDSSEVPNISLFESFISYLNKMHLLKKLVKFDYTER